MYVLRALIFAEHGGDWLRFRNFGAKSTILKKNHDLFKHRLTGFKPP